MKLVCISCQHFNKDTVRADESTCAAFPKGIPFIVLSGQNDHSAPIPGDHGKIFQKLSVERTTHDWSSIDQMLRDALEKVS